MAVWRKIIFHFTLHFICYHSFYLNLDLDVIIQNHFDHFLENVLFENLIDQFFEIEWTQKGFAEACESLTLEALNVYFPLYGIQNVEDFDEVDDDDEVGNEDADEKEHFVKARETYLRKAEILYEGFITRLNEVIDNR